MNGSTNTIAGSVSRNMKLPQSTVEQQDGNVKMGRNEHRISQPQTDNIIKINSNVIDINDIKYGSDIGNVSAPRESLGLEPEISTPGQIDMSNVSEADVPAEERVLPKDLEGGNPAFSFASLDEITSGDFNVGELKIKADGSLGKINNHVRGFRWKNKVKLTPEQNLEVRKQTWKCLEMTCNDPAHQAEFPGRGKLETVKKLLLNERDRTVALSRDEVHFLIAMLKTDAPASPYKAENFKKLHEFKIGKEANASEVRTFIKGLAAGNSDTQKRVARSVSANAQQSIVSFVLNEIKNFFLGLFGNGTFVKRDVVESGLKNEFGSTGNLNERRNYDVFGKKSLDKVFESLERNFRLPENLKLERNVPIRTRDNNDPNHFLVNVKREVCNRVQREISDQADGLNPYRVLNGNGRIHMRQTPGSRVYGVVSMINAVCQSGNEDAIRRLKERFTDDGCTLLDNKGNLVTYKYKDFLTRDDNLPGDDNLSPFERIVMKHVKELNVLNSSDILGNVYSILGFNGHELNTPYETDHVVDKDDAEGKGEDFVRILLKEKAFKGIQGKNIPGRNIVCASQGSLTHPTEGGDDWHYYSLRLPETEARANMVFEGGRPVGVKVHVVSSQPDGPNGECEFDHVLKFVDIQRMFVNGKIKLNLITPAVSNRVSTNNAQKLNYRGDSPLRAEKRGGVKGSVKKGTLARKLDLARLVDSMKKTGTGMYGRYMKLLKGPGREQYTRVELASMLHNAQEMALYQNDLKEEDVIWLLQDYAKAKKLGQCEVKKNDMDEYTTNLEFNETDFAEWAIRRFASLSYRTEEDSSYGAGWRKNAVARVKKYMPLEDENSESLEEDFEPLDMGEKTYEP